MQKFSRSVNYINFTTLHEIPVKNFVDLHGIISGEVYKFQQ